MFCSHCGSKATGTFCWKCGQKLHVADTERSIPDAEQSTPAEESIATQDFDVIEFDGRGNDWTYEVDYRKIIRHPTVRDLLVMAGNRAKQRVSAEQILEVLDNVAPGASLAAIAVQPLFFQLGIKTSKSTSLRFRVPVGTTLVSILCAFAEGGNKLRDVKQADDGCLLEASIPSDIWSFEGVLYVQIQRDGDGTNVEAATRIPGQFFDWGKSQRLLDRLIGNVRRAA